MVVSRMELNDEDLKYWCKQVPQWELHELCFLLNDFPPPADSRVYEAVIFDRNTPFGQLYFGLRKCVINEIELAGIRHPNVDIHHRKTIHDWMQIVQKYGYDVPPKLEKSISLYTPVPSHKPQEIKKPKKAEKLLGKRERETLLRIIIAMAVNKYGYVPNAAKSGGVTRIMNAIALAGFDVSDDTVRAKLQEAAEFLSPEFIEQK